MKTRARHGRPDPSTSAITTCSWPNKPDWEQRIWRRSKSGDWPSTRRGIHTARRKELQNQSSKLLGTSKNQTAIRSRKRQALGFDFSEVFRQPHGLARDGVAADVTDCVKIF